jgi:type IX secretion system PorP/SprF family membrane protein
MNRVKSFLKRLEYFLLMMLPFAGELYAQDPQFSQFYANPVYVNPAFAGSSKVGRFVLNSRSQWPSISGSFTTGSISYDEHFNNINGGIALQAVYDEQGVGTLRTFGFNFAYAYEIPVTRNFTIRAAVQAGFFQKSIDFSKLLWYDQIVRTQGFVNPTNEPPGNPSIISPNFGTGIIGYSRNFYAGFAIHNIFEPSQKFFTGAANPVPRRFTGNMGLIVPIREDKTNKRSINLYPNVIVMSQRQFNQVNLGMYVNRGPFIVGGYFRQNTVNSDAFIIVAGIRTGKVKFGYSYDGTVSNARRGAVNSHEISMAYEIKKRNPRVKVRKVTCPDF